MIITCLTGGEHDPAPYVQFGSECEMTCWPMKIR